MIKFITGNIFDSPAKALVNTVNTVGIMGKGIALQFKKEFPLNYKLYFDACKKSEVKIGKLFVVKDSNYTGVKFIINFPTKKHWRSPSQYEYIEKGLDDLILILEKYNISSIAIPPLGAGNGGLKWGKVKEILVDKLSHLNIDIYIYEPSKHIREKLKKERAKLTDARALLLYVLYDLVRNGEYVSEFSSEKVCYFLQKFGAQKYFKLNFKPQFYGPYSGKVRYLLSALNGSYLMGYAGMNSKPFDPLTLISDGFPEIQSYIESNSDLSEIAHKTMKFLNGYYSDFALELLSSVDYISIKANSIEKEVILYELNKWSDRKQSMFSNPKYLNVSIQHISSSLV